jgi:predicted amidohydrolase
MTDKTVFSRREAFLAAAGGAALIGTAALGPREARAAMGKGPDAIAVAKDGNYAVADLAKDSWTLGVIQSRVRAVDETNIEPTRKANLDHMLQLIDNAFSWGPRPDLIFFHEFPITGWSGRWDRQTALKVAIEIPGPETDAIAAKAKQYGCWIVFGSYAREKDWEGHLLSITTIMGPDGQIVDKHWKARNVKGVFVGFELFTTTIYDVLDRYKEMYGADAVVPVNRTPLGNIATSSIQREPELMRAFAMKGAEVILRTATGGFTEADMAVTSLHNGVYTALCNNAVSPDNPGFFEEAGSGGSCIWGPDGREIAKAENGFEQMLTARIPIAEFRARRRLPQVHIDLYRDVFDTYVNRYPPNLWSEYIPNDGQDAARYLKDKAVWVK